MYKLLKLTIALSFINGLVFAQTENPDRFNCMKWRMIGPFRGGRTVGTTGVNTQPGVFYIGVNNGGVWKTNDYGHTWQPIFDEQATGSIGDVAVAQSNPDVIYVGSGEGLHRPDLSVGDGIYKSIDKGKTWSKTSFPNAQQIGKLAVDPANENRVFVAALGHPYGASAERGVYRTLDGGKTWQKVFYIDENTGAMQVEIDPSNPDIIYADMWAGRLAPWENGGWNGPGSGLFKSTDGGNTWKKLTSGLPTFEKGLGRIGFCISPSDHKRLYATTDARDGAGLYRSDDEGETWTKLSSDERLWGRGDDFAELKVDPKNKDIVYDANVVVWKSKDGGKHWDAIKGAPGGDDSHRLWISPDNTNIILLAGDQGACITVNGGETWSSWYNQPTAQLYHVSADNAFPYNVYGGQQESGSVGIASRGNDGAITFRDWHPVSAEEWGYVTADPLNSDIIYGGKLTRYDKRTGQVVDISPEPINSPYRFLRTAPVIFSPLNPRLLFYAGNVLFKTYNGGDLWQVISPDLTRTTYDVPENIGVYKTEAMKTMPQRGVIYTIAPSPVDSNTIWIGTDDGLIQVTHDGGKIWNNVTPPALTDWSKVSLMDASHTDVNTAYAAVNRIRLDDMHPHIYRTNDGGKTWKQIVNGLPDDPINVVREDPGQKGLLFAGSERAVYVSFDEGEHWQSLRLNMPATSIRDLVIKDDDIVVATHGRSFWILDDITVLRQLRATKAEAVVLYKPANAYRVRWNMNPDTPLPPEEPVGQNPPDGAIIDYYLKEKAGSDIVLDILDNKGKVLRSFSSRDTAYKIPDVNIPLYWIRPEQMLSREAGSHRFLWEMHYSPLNVPAAFPISAIVGNTAPVSTSPWVMPGRYSVRLTVNGKAYTQLLEIRMDPRVKTTLADLQLQHDISMACYNQRQQVLQAIADLKTWQLQLKQLNAAGTKSIADTLNSLSLKINALSAFNGLSENLETIFNLIQAADVPVTAQAIKASETLNTRFKSLMQSRENVLADIKRVNMELKKAGEKELLVK